MLGSLAQAQESSECEVSLKGILHQPVDVCLPRGSFTGKVEKEGVPEKVFWVGGTSNEKICLSDWTTDKLCINLN